MLVRLHENICIRRLTKFISSEQLINELQKRTVKFVLNVAPARDITFVEAAATAGITYCHAPLRDNSCIAEHEVKRLVQAVVAEVNRGNGVMIHCNQARNRSALIAILAIIKLTGREQRKPSVRHERSGRQC